MNASLVGTIFVSGVEDIVGYCRSDSIAIVISQEDPAICGINALIKESEINISISDSINKLVMTTNQPEYQYINVESDKGMNGRLEKIESDITRIDGSLNEINGALNSLKGLPNQAKTANLIGSIILAALAIITGLFGSNLSSLSDNVRFLNDKVYKLTEDVSTIKADLKHVSKAVDSTAEIKELREDARAKLDILLERTNKK